MEHIHQPDLSFTDELLEMAYTDQAMRTPDMDARTAWDPSVGAQNTNRLIEIVQEIGWPTISKVGEKASHAAWLIVQHAHEAPDFMRHCLGLMKEVINDIRIDNIAFLEDALLVMDGKEQLYGTQFHRADDKWCPFPIKDREYVDERRRTMNLNTLAENLAQMQEFYGS